MADFDEISRALGRIEGEMQEQTRQSAALFQKFDTINEEVIEARGAMKMLASTQGDLKAAHEDMKASIATDLKPAIDDYKALRNKGVGALFGMGLAGGSIGAGLVALAQRLLGMSAGPHSP